MTTLRIFALISTVATFLYTFTLARMEYGDRTLGMIVGLLILTTAILAIRNAPGFPRVWIPTFVSTLLVAGVVWQGGHVVTNGLEPLLITAHLMLSLMTALLLLLASMQLRFIRHPYAERRPLYPTKLNGWLTFILILAFLQTGLGTVLRSALKIVSELEPLGGYNYWASNVDSIAIVHQTLGVLIALLVMHKAAVLIKQAEWPTPLVYQVSLAAGGYALGLVLIGVSMLIFGHLPILQMFHLWLASLLLGSLVIILASVKYNFLSSISSYKLDGKR